MEVNKKPKCRSCDKVGEDDVYVYRTKPRGPGGDWWHLKCYVKGIQEIHESADRAIKKSFKV